MMHHSNVKIPSVFSVLLCVLCVLSCASSSADYVRFDFEDGTLQGWTVVSGDAGKQPVDKDDDRWSGNFSKQGKYFIGTYENLKDDAEVELRSPVFTLSARTISLLVGGGNHPGATHVALCRASDGEELISQTGNNAEAMQRRLWDVSQHTGQKVYLKIVDRERGGWGHINVDDIRELSPQDEAKLEAERRERAAANDKWLADLMAPTGRKVHRGRELTDIAMCLGGIGAGNIAVCGDGALRQWQIFNKVNSGCVVPGQFFAVWARAGSKDPVVRMLRCDPEVKPVVSSNCNPATCPGGACLQVGAGGAPSSSDDPCWPLVRETEFIGEFPIAEIRYKDPALPVSISMEAFSPFIPMDARSSGVPGIYFAFRVKNLTRETVSVSLASSLQNAVNYDGRSQIQGLRFRGYGGNSNELAKQPGLTMISMSNPGLPADEHQFGTMALGVLSTETSSLAQWDNPALVALDFARDGRFDGPAGSGPSRKGRTWNGALAVPLTLKPGEQKSVVFLIAWHFPNFYADYDANLAKYRIGRVYSNWYKDARDVAGHMALNYGSLSKRTRLFRDTMYDSNLPYWFTDRVSAPVSTLTSQTCMWIEDGTFHAFEGIGCCPMNCTHVFNYEQSIAYLFPELERNMRHTDLTVQQEPSGAVRHRTVLPLSAPRGTGPFVDGHLGTILKGYREHRNSSDRKWLDEMWPRIKLAMDFVVRDWDPNGDGVLVNEQWNTYDAAMYGPNTFIGTLYLAALRAAEEMARIQGDDVSASGYRAIFESGSKRLDSLLWNGEYYIHIDEKREAEQIADAAWLTQDWPQENSAAHVNRPYGTGCHADQLLGQWWADILELGYLLPQDRVRTALDSIMKYNWRWDFGEVAQQRVFASNGDKGLLICTWPKDGRPTHATLYSDEDWTGIDYEVAGLLIHEGKIADAYRIVKAICDRYNGVPRQPFKRNPWNEIECGEHYARAMSSWAMLRIAQGLSYSGPDGSIGFNPVIQPENHRSLFTTAEGWGTFSQRRTSTSQANTLELAYGQVVLKSLTFHLARDARPESIVLALGRKSLPLKMTQDGEVLTIVPDEPAAISAGQKLSLEVEW